MVTDTLPETFEVEMPEEEAPKRGRGRPRKNDATVEGTTQERKPKRSKLKFSIAGVKKGIHTALSFVNAGLCVVIPAYIADQLAPDEIALLTDALAEEVEQNEKLQKLFMQVAKVSPHMKLIYAISVIALPRLTKRGIIPNAFTVPMETGGTSSGNRDNGNWQNYPS